LGANKVLLRNTGARAGYQGSINRPFHKIVQFPRL